MKYKVLTFDGRWVNHVHDDRITYREFPRLLDYDTTMEQLLSHKPYINVIHNQRRCTLLRKCELVEVELKILKDV